MSATLYELLGADDRRFSPYCWRTRMALAHKGITPEYVACRFGDKGRMAFAGYERYPLLADGDRSIGDSWAIACYLEDAYPDRPSLFGGATGRAAARFINTWADRELQPALLPMIVKDIHDHLDPADQPYFRQSREQRLGMTLEALHARREERKPTLARVLDLLRAQLADQPYLSGAVPAYVDYIAFGAFQLARSISPYRLVEKGDALYDWRARMLGLYGGLGRSVNAYPE
jgi:glutathione S-transferase